MQARRVGDDGHLLVLERGEKVVETLLGYAAGEHIEGGWISGLGSLCKSTLGYYDLHKKVYYKREFPDDMELTGLQGNVAMDGEERILHLHCCLSGPELITFSGHLFEGEVAVLAEFFLLDFHRRIDRRLAPELGLRGIDLGGAVASRKEPTPPARHRPRRRTGR